MEGNPITSVSSEIFPQSKYLLSLTLQLPIKYISPSSFKGLVGLLSLEISNASISFLPGQIFSFLTTLKNLSLKNSMVGYFESSLYRSIPTLYNLEADYRGICCIAQNLVLCNSLPQRTVYCPTLIPTKSLKVGTCIIILACVISNGLGLYMRFSNHKTTPDSMLLINMHIADVCVICYLTSIAFADAIFGQSFGLNEHYWIKSYGCKTLACISGISYQMPVSTIALISIERFMHITKHRHIWSERNRGIFICLLLWAFWASICLILSSVFNYLQTKSCLIYNVFAGRYMGWGLVLITFSFMNFLMLGLALVLYVKVYKYMIISSWRLNRYGIKTDRKAQFVRHTALFLIPNIFCWISLFILMVSTTGGSPDNQDMSVLVGVFVFPLYAFINPIVYEMKRMHKR